MPKFRKVPVVIEAVRLKYPIVVSTLEGDMSGEVGDWLITGVEGEQYCCKNNIFMKTYEAADEDAEEYLEKYGTVAIAPKDFEDLATDPKPVKNTLGEKVHPRFEGRGPITIRYEKAKVSRDALEMMQTEQAIRDYNKQLHEKEIEDLRKELFEKKSEPTE